MANTELGTLPIELRDKIWMLALLPDPSVYSFDPDWFTPLEGLDDFEDWRWMIPKRKYPTAMHLCQESRRFCQYIAEREQKQERKDGTPPYYYLGYSTRPFDPEIDTFWFSQESLLLHPWVGNLDSVVGSQIHTIKNLALSSQYLEDTTLRRVSTWNSFRWRRFGRFVSLRRVNVIFGVTWVDDDSKFKSGGSYIDLNKAPHLRLEQWTEGLSMTETLDEVETKIDQVQASTTEAFQGMVERMRENEDEESPLPEGAPWWQDGSKITFHAAQITTDRGVSCSKIA